MVELSAVHKTLAENCERRFLDDFSIARGASNVATQQRSCTFRSCTGRTCSELRVVFQMFEELPNSKDLRDGSEASKRLREYLESVDLELIERWISEVLRSGSDGRIL